MRIYELAKELDINSKKLLEIVKKELNLEVHSHMSSISDLDTLKVKDLLNKKNSKGKEEKRILNTQHNNNKNDDKINKDNMTNNNDKKNTNVDNKNNNNNDRRNSNSNYNNNNNDRRNSSSNYNNNNNDRRNSSSNYNNNNNDRRNSNSNYNNNNNDRRNSNSNYNNNNNDRRNSSSNYNNNNNDRRNSSSNYNNNNNDRRNSSSNYNNNNNDRRNSSSNYNNNNNDRRNSNSNYNNSNNDRRNSNSNYNNNNNDRRNSNSNYNNNNNDRRNSSSNYNNNNNDRRNSSSNYNNNNNDRRNSNSNYNKSNERNKISVSSDKKSTSSNYNNKNNDRRNSNSNYNNKNNDKRSSNKYGSDKNKRGDRPVLTSFNSNLSKNRGKSKKNKNRNKNKNNDNNFNQQNQQNQQNLVAKNKVVEMEDTIVVRDFADKLGIPVSQILSKLIMLGLMVNMNQEIDLDTATLIAEEFGAVVEKVVVVDELDLIEEKLLECNNNEDKEDELAGRPPIVTVMGHVDHGKTSLLDAIRNTVVTSNEAGGITQHIGASVAEINGKKITFLDTPGHEAFTSMRARGASITDIAILVVAADDGVKPQTIEAINHAKAANVPLIVAVNKMDKPTADLNKVKQELTEHGVLAEDWGGDTIFAPVSAKQQQGIEELLEMILLVAEMQELKANPNKKARGTIVEAKLDKSRGPVATILVQDGTLNKGDIVLVGPAHGKVRAMFSSRGKRIAHAGPSIPVEILGLSETPNAGDIMYVMDNDKEAKSIAEKRRNKLRTENMNATAKVSLDDLFERIQQGDVQDLNIILKADVRGSIEAVKQSFEKLSVDEVKVNIIHCGVGGINESDINLASASNAIVIGFNVRPSVQASEIAKREQVDVRTYNIIYNAIEDVKSAIKGMLAPEYKEVVQGRAEVRATFKVPNVGLIAGVYVTNGKVTRKSKVRLLRDDIVIHDGEIGSLKRFKDDASELNTGYEGGLGIDNYNDLKEGDVIEAYIMEEIER